ncbi:hypothetical protein [Desulfosporosinus nitroreducens]|uniref:hypothetical protein n=1 Tax=Desulfosporosinus nitroreducens TaxID=2018668 RepID=UPI00207CA6D8|nr:hypothetical protein [Desulfosporosinus nitroreducens]MCO1599753.1 hypothetical protein [Desulfosporosinus nitroreducens]
MYEDKEIKIGKRTFPAVFNVVALQEIVKRFGGVEEMGKELEKDYVKAIDEYAWIIALLVGQGIALKNFEDGTDEKAPNPEQIKLCLKPHEFIHHRQTIFSVVRDGMNSGSEVRDEEEVDEVLEEVLASKNVMGARE